MEERYLNPHTDFGFKRLFGSEFNKELLEQAEISKFNPQELMQYEDSVNAYRDIVNAINTAKKDSFAEGVAKGIAEGVAKGIAEGVAKGIAEGVAKGIEQRNVEIARKMLGKGMTPEEVADMTGLSIADVDGLE